MYIELKAHNRINIFVIQALWQAICFKKIIWCIDLDVFTSDGELIATAYDVPDTNIAWWMVDLMVLGPSNIHSYKQMAGI